MVFSRRLRGSVRAWGRFIFTGLVFLLWTAATPALAQKSSAPPPKKAPAAAQPAAPSDQTAITPDDIQRTIDLLENEERRREVVKLLKLMAVLQGESGLAVSPASGAQAPEARGADTEIKAYLSALAEGVYRDVKSSGAGLAKSWQETKAVFTALAKPQAVDLWRPYLLQIHAWGLLWLLVTLVIIKKFGRLPEPSLAWDFFTRLKAVAKYILVVAGPNLILIFSLLATPGLSTTAPGIPVDMATGFSFLHAMAQHFFINLSVLYIFLQAAKVLFTTGRTGQSIINIHPVLARHVLNSLRVFATYIACFLFFKETILENFVTGSLYSFTLIFLTVPIPVYATFRLLKLKRLVTDVTEAEASAGDSGAEDFDSDDKEFSAADATPTTAHLDYRVDRFIRRHWSSLALIFIWGISLISIVNPADIANQFGSRFFGSAVLMGLGALAVKLERIILRRAIPLDSRHGRRLLLNLDNLTNIVVWTGLAAIVVTLWGLPLERILGNAVTREIIGRLFTIAVTIIGLMIFLKFSRLAMEWLLSVPDLSHNRNWRTMTPLLLTAVRALAIFVAVVVVLERLGVNVGPILAGAGILGLGVGMGAQSLVKDVINGVSILLMDTLSVGDYVTIGGKSGTVETVGLRSIRLRDAAGNLTVVPNSSVDTIVNMTRDYSQDLIEFTVPYDAHPDDMLRLAGEVARDLSDDHDWRRYLIGPVNVLGVIAFDANGTTLRLKINTTAGNQWAVGRELRLRLKRKMLEAGYTSSWFGQNVVVHPGDPDYNESRKKLQADGGSDSNNGA